MLAAFRFVAGVGIGGEYSAINSAIDELIPSHYRGRVDIAINGTYWGGAAIGAAANLYLLSDGFPWQSWGWRIGFFIGPVLGLLIIGLRRHIPESPRWQMTHGFSDEANATVDGIEEQVRAHGRQAARGGRAQGDRHRAAALAADQPAGQGAVQGSIRGAPRWASS